MALINNQQKIVVFVGGVGGAKLAYGLYHSVPPENLTVIVNVGDDFWHYGLRICPDVDTIMYTLSGWVNQDNGWGVAGDTTAMLDTLRLYGEDGWFGLGDRDLATHLLRTQQLREGKRLTEVIGYLARQQGIQCAVLPVTDDEVATILHTAEHGVLEFQPYFVKHRWQPRVNQIEYRGATTARLTPEVSQAINAADLILFAPSNPWLSVEPMLAIDRLREQLMARDVPRVAITPIVGGKAIKGPAAKIMQELGYEEISSRTVAAFYGEVINGFIADEQDKDFDISGLYTTRFDTLMSDNDDKIRLAQQVLAALQEWGA